MTKKTATFTLDPDVWLAFNTQVPDRQRSSTINSLLRNFLAVQDENTEESEIKENIEKLQEQMREITTQLATESARLSSARTKQIKTVKEAQQRQKEAVQSGVLRSI